MRIECCFLGVSLVAAACAPSGRSAPAPVTGLGELSTALRLEDVPPGVSAVRYRVVDAAEPCEGEVLEERVSAIESEALPEWLATEPWQVGVSFADAFFALPAGDYRVCVEALDAEGQPSAVCGSAEGVFTVVAELTTEGALYMQCEGDPSGGLDVTAGFNVPPHIDELEYAPSKFITACESVSISVEASDTSGDVLTYLFEVKATPPGGDSAVLVSNGASATFSSATPGPYQLLVTVNDMTGGSARLQFPVHVSPCGPGAPPSADPGVDPPPPPSPDPSPQIAGFSGPDPFGFGPQVVATTDPSLGEAEQPLPNRRPLIHHARDLALVGASTPGAPVSLALLNGQNGFADTLGLPAGAAPWAQARLLKGLTVGSLDQDGPEETVSVSVIDAHHAQVAVVDPDMTGAFAQSVVADIQLPPSRSIGDVDIVAADVDGDGLDEVVVSLAGGDARDLDAWSGLWIFDDALAGYAPLASREIPQVWRLRLAAVNLDAGEAAELVTAASDVDGRAWYAIWRVAGGLIDFVGTGALAARDPAAVSALNPDGLVPMSTADVTAADLDVDGTTELIFASAQRIIGWPNSTDYAVVGGHFDGRALNLDAGFGFRARSLGPIGRADPEDITEAIVETVAPGLGRPRQIVINDLLVKWDPATRAYTHSQTLNFDDLLDRCPGDALVLRPYVSTRADMTLAVGDFDDDGREEIAYLIANTCAIAVFGADAAGNYSRSREIAVQGVVDRGDSPVLAAPDTKAQVIRLEYIGHSVTVTDPIVIAVMAAAPCYDDGVQETGDCTTTFARSVNQAMGQEETLTVNAKMAAGMSVNLGVFEASMQAYVEASVSESVVSTQSREFSRGFTGGASNDSVVLTYVPYDVYSYLITEAPDPLAVGETYFVALPRAPLSTTMAVDEYDARLQDPSRRLGGRVFRHTPGDPSSYSEPGVARSRLGVNGLESEAIGVEVGDQSQSAGITLSEEVSKTSGFAIGVGVEVGVTVFGASVSAEVGVEGGEAITVSTGASTSYESSVSNLRADAGDRRYDTAMLVYPSDALEDPPAGPPFVVIDYWVLGR